MVCQRSGGRPALCLRRRLTAVDHSAGLVQAGAMHASTWGCRWRVNSATPEHPLGCRGCLLSSGRYAAKRSHQPRSLENFIMQCLNSKSGTDTWTPPSLAWRAGVLGASTCHYTILARHSLTASALITDQPVTMHLAQPWARGSSLTFKTAAAPLQAPITRGSFVTGNGSALKAASRSLARGRRAAPRTTTRWASCLPTCMLRLWEAFTGEMTPSL